MLLDFIELDGLGNIYELHHGVVLVLFVEWSYFDLKVLFILGFYNHIFVKVLQQIEDAKELAAVLVRDVLQRASLIIHEDFHVY